MRILDKQFCLLAILCIAITFCNAQPTNFGEFTTEEKLLKHVDFDKEADAVILFDMAIASYNDDYNLLLQRRTRIKILKEKGVSLANVEIPFYSKDKFESIYNLKAIVYTEDGNKSMVIKELQRSDIFTTKLNDYVSLVKFALPNVKPGSIIEYNYESHSKHFGGLDNWYFQKEIPVLFSSFFLAVPPRQEFAYNVHKSQDIPIDINNDKREGTVKFSMKNIAGLRDEPFMDAPKDYLQHVDFQFSGYVNSFGSKVNYVTKWSEVSRELMGESHFGKLINKSISGTEELVSRFKAISNQTERIKAIHEYVTQKFTWNGIRSKYATDGLKDCWEKRSGHSGEINLLFINLLKSSGLDVYPLLISERKHGKVTLEYPILDEFSNTFAYVQADGNTFIMDGTDHLTPTNLTPESILNTNAFLVDNKKGSLMKIANETAGNFTTVNIFSTISDKGVLNGEASILNTNYARLERGADYRRDKELFKNAYLQKNIVELKVDSLVLSNLENDSLPLQQDFRFTLPVQSSGDYKLVNVNLFTGLEKNPFISDNRFTDINFGNRQQVTVVGQYVIPANFKLEEVPKNVQMIMPDKSITMARTASLSENVVLYQFSLKINRPVFTAEEYPGVKEFYKKMYTFLDEPLVLTNK